jgi:cytochrome P450
VLDFRRDPLGYLLDVAARYGPVVKLRLGLRPAILFCDPDAIQTVLQTRHQIYLKERSPLSRMRLVLGEGLATTSGTVWLHSRRQMQPAFQPAAIGPLMDPVSAVAAEEAGTWREGACRGQPLEMHAAMLRLSFRIAGTVLFGSELSGVAGRASEALQEIERQADERLYDLLPVPTWWPTADNARFHRALGVLNATITEVLHSRDLPSRNQDLLQLLLGATGPEGDRLTDGQLRDQIITILLGAHESTGNTLTWVWHMLSCHQDCQDGVQREVDRVLGTRLAGWDDIPQLPYTRTVILETMRLRPVSWLLLRTSATADRVNEVVVPRGALVLLSPWVTHRHPEFWPEPERFDPRRFSVEQSSGRHRFAFFPFGGGPRRCIGEVFASAVMTLVVATVAQQWRIAPMPGHPVEPAPRIFLGLRQGLRLRLEPRTHHATA